MKEKRMAHLLEVLDYHADTLARIPLTNLGDVGEAAALLISSVLGYHVVVLLIEGETKEPELLASKGIDNDIRGAWTAREGFVRHLWGVIDSPSILECSTLDSASARSARRLGLGEIFLAVPLRGFPEHEEDRVGLVVAAQPHGDYDPNVDIMAVEILAGIVGGAIGKCIAMTKLLEINKAMNTEINRRKQAEEAVRESQERYRTLVEDMPALVCRFLSDGTLTFVNSSYREYFKKNSEDLIGENFFQFIPEQEREKVRNHFQFLTHRRPMVTYEHQVVTPYGEIRWQRWTDRALFDGQGNLSEYQSMGFDVTERKWAEEAIKRRFEFEKTVSTISSRFVNVTDIDNAINSSLGDMGRICGAGRSYLFLFRQGRTMMDNTHEWCAEGVSPQIDNLKNLPCERFPWWMKKLANGEVIHINNVSKMPAEAKAEKEMLESQEIKSLLVLPLCVKGELAGFIGLDNVMETGEWRDDDLAILRTSAEIIGNALERKQTEKILRESELKFRTLFDLSPQPIALSEASTGKFIDVNDKFCELTQYTREEILGRTATECRLYSKQDRHKFIKRLAGSGEVHGLEMDFRAKDGSMICGLMFSKLVRIAGQSLIVTVFLDLTDHKRLEAQLIQAQKMEAIGTLAGGIAHKFNNALVGISGNVELLQMDLPDDDKIDEYVRRMKDSTRQMANLTNQLLAYARGGKYQPKTISLNDFVEDTVPLIQHSIDSTIRVETDLPRDISRVAVDLSQMQMVLSAVLNNASEAMEGKGRIRIITRDEKIDGEFAENNPGLKPGPYVCLTIKDDGKGMDEETRSRIFDPFFTTKFQGRGLGMAAAYGIIKNHNGWISVDSQLGKGTAVRIYLPAVKVEKEQRKEFKTEMTTGTGTILVIEDEHVVIDVIRPMLERLGYRVLLAKTGKEAVEVAKAFDGDIDLAILDIVLPDMRGNKVYPLIMEARPNLKVIVCTGYAIDGPAKEVLDAGAQDFIQKPFSVETLSEKLNKVLGGQIGN